MSVSLKVLLKRVWNTLFGRMYIEYNKIVRILYTIEYYFKCLEFKYPKTSDWADRRKINDSVPLFFALNSRNRRENNIFFFF